MGLENDVEIQRRYFAEIADRYHDECVRHGDEHFFALSFLLAAINHFGFESVLDVGSGTGRAISYIKERRPDLRVVGIEPVKELREVGHRSGISRDELIEGDATRIQFGCGDFDLVCAFGAMHHIRYPSLAISEMLRVARRAILISDSNNFGQGSRLSRTAKQILNSVGLWKVADFIKTRGKGYTISEGDGLAYSYSVFDDYKLINKECKSVHVVNTTKSGVNQYRSASHVTLLGVKERL
jgi:SAM-dependent methyltransferase